MTVINSIIFLAIYDKVLTDCNFTLFFFYYNNRIMYRLRIICRMSEYIENVILYDKLLFLSDSFPNTYYIPIFPKKVSPRNIAIVSEKE